MLIRSFMLILASILLPGCDSGNEQTTEPLKPNSTNAEAEIFAMPTKYLQTRDDLLAGELMAVAYSGFREGQHPDRGDGAVNPSKADISEDLDILLAHDFRLIRLYDSGENSAMVLKLIRERQLPIKVLLGIWLEAELSNHEGCPWLNEPIPQETLTLNTSKNAAEIASGIELANEFSDIVVAVNVGNEALVDWNDHMVTLDNVIRYVRRVKTGIDQPVTVADNYEWWIRNGAPLAAEVDFIGVHTYPVWENKSIDEGIGYTMKNIEDVRAALPGNPIAILEAGWTSNSEEFPEQSNEVNQRRYYRELRQWAEDTNTTVFFFEAFDEPWKGNPDKPAGAEKHWGLFNVDRTPKEVMGDSQFVLYDREAVVWANNVGGSEYVGIDGVRYEADQYITGGDIGAVDKILGAQDSEVYKSYRSGDLKLRRPIANGTYSVSFQFAEPEDIEAGTRVFDIIAQGKKVIAALDVRLARDGRHLSALERTVTNVVVSNGQLEIDFIAQAHKPVLSGIVVRATSPDYRNWELSWADEFDYEGAPDPDKWNFDIWEAHKVNGEDQAYTDREKNVRVSGGKLILEAHREDYNGASYTSARIQSQGKRDVLYGRIDVRARLPQGQGTWPAIWMLPSDPYRYATSCSPGEEWQGSTTCDAWPNSGEIDIMEHVGYDMGRVHGTVHNIAYYWANWEQRKGSIEVRDIDKEFHIYSLIWTPTEIHMSVDGSHYFSYFNESTGWKSWPYDHPYHLILNVAIGGMWGKAGGPIDDSVFPVRMEVDYVRVFSDSSAK